MERYAVLVVKLAEGTSPQELYEEVMEKTMCPREEVWIGGTNEEGALKLADDLSLVQVNA